MWLCGTAVNQDGRTSSLTAPNGPSQTRVIKSALANASTRPLEVRALEMHGTGTPLGDPIEVGGAMSVLGQAETLRLHAIKTNMGHAECAAGMAGLISASRAVEMQRHTGIMHMRLLNVHAWHAMSINPSQEPNVAVPRSASASCQHVHKANAKT